MAMDGRYASNAGAIAGVWPWMAGMPAMQEQLLVYGHGWPVCQQCRSSCWRCHGWRQRAAL